MGEEGGWVFEMIKVNIVDVLPIVNDCCQSFPML
jgi:hypothetical protein